MTKKMTPKQKKTSRLKTVVCEDCGESFNSTSPRVKYCPKCRLKRFRPRNPIEIKTCACGCGLEFETSRPWAIFYNTKHRQAYHRQKMEEMLKGGQNAR